MERNRDAADFTRWGLCLGLAKGALSTAEAEFERRVGPRGRNLERVKSSVGALYRGSAAVELRPLSDAFLGLVAQRSALDKLAAIAPRVEFNTTLANATVEAGITWTGEGKPAPVVAGTFANVTVEPFRLGGIVALTREAAAANDARSLAALSRSLAIAAAKGSDAAAFTPSAAAVAYQQPASLLYDATAITPTADVEADALSVLAALSGGAPTQPVFVLSTAVAIALAGRRNSDGARLFPDLRVDGGTMFGVPVIVGAGVPDQIAAFDADALALAIGDAEIEASTEASLQMDDNPGTQSGLTGAGTSLVSLFQINGVALQVSRFVGWTRRADAAAYRAVSLNGSPVF